MTKNPIAKNLNVNRPSKVKPKRGKGSYSRDDNPTDPTDAEQSGDDKPWQFKPGVSGNPSGRTKGGRNKLSEAFWTDLNTAWKAHGEQAIVDMIADKPGDFVRVVATQMPRELNVVQNPLGDLSDSELADAIDFIRASLSAASGDVSGGTDKKTRH